MCYPYPTNVIHMMVMDLSVICRKPRYMRIIRNRHLIGGAPQQGANDCFRQIPG